MKILYATQRTGNGHIARAQELIPIISKLGELHILASGSNSQIQLSQPITYSFKGISLYYSNGKVSYLKTFLKNNFILFLYNVISFPTKSYDLIINDFEPISAWSCKLKGGNIISLSHQAALLFNETPKAKTNSIIGKAVLKYYAPTKIKYGFHFKSYHPQILLPIIRSKIKTLTTSNHRDYLVYLPSYTDLELIKILTQINIPWHIFTKFTNSFYQTQNCKVYPIDEILFLEKLASCEGVLCNAGFELPTEAMYLKKKLFVIPIQFQIEQEYNAISAKELGAEMAYDLNINAIKKWVKNDQIIDFHDCKDSYELLKKIIKKHPKKFS